MSTKEIHYHLTNPEVLLALLTEVRSTCQVFAFTGSLGAGKTTLIRLLLKKWGILETITSPTFTYVNCYKNKNDQYFYHFDLYRIASLDEFIEQGFNEYLYQDNSWSLIEWPEIIVPLLTHNVCFVSLEYVDEQQRKATISWQ